MGQELKAALDGAIAACALSPDTAVQLLERLLQAVVVTPVAPSASVLPRYDLTYQLNEIEVCPVPHYMKPILDAAM